MAWYRAGGGGIPSSLKTGMNSVLNKKFGTATTYDPAGWPDDVNLLGKLPEKTASGALVNITDGADEVPLKDLIFSASPIQAEGTPSPSNPLPISGHTEMNGVHCGKNLLNADKSQTIVRDKTIQCSLKAGTYTMSFDLISTTADPSPSYLQVAYATDDGTKYNPVTIPSSGKCTRTFTFAFDSPRFTIYASESYASSVGVTTIIDNLMIEVGSSASTSFAPYSAETKKWTFPPFGKNLFDKNAIENDKYLDTTTGLPVTEINYVVSNYIAVKKDIPIYIPNTWTARRWFYDVNKTPKTYLNTSSAQLYTPTEDGYIRVSILKTQVDIDTFQIELSGVSSYEPYQSMFAGSVNALTGEVENGYKKIVVTSTSDISRSDGKRYYIVNSKTGARIPSADEATVFSDKLKSMVGGGQYDDRVWLNNSGAIRWNTATDYESIGDMLADFGGSIEFCFPLANPISIDMDSVDWQTQLGDNNFYNDCGDTSVTYRADIDLALGGN